MTASQKMRLWRRANNLSQRAAAERVGVSQPTWQAYETGRQNNPTADIVEKFERATSGSIYCVSLADWLESSTAAG